MQKKAMTYILSFLVAGVWGLIIYRILKATGGDDEPVQTTEHVQFKVAANDYTISKDTTHLLLNYRDPFSEKKEEPVKPVTKEPAIQTGTIKIQKPSINWGFIKYSGYINNAGSKRLVAMVNVNGKELMMSEGEMAEQVRLVKNLKDSIKIIYQGHTKFITLNNHTP